VAVAPHGAAVILQPLLDPRLHLLEPVVPLLQPRLRPRAAVGPPGAVAGRSALPVLCALAVLACRGRAALRELLLQALDSGLPPRDPLEHPRDVVGPGVTLRR